MRIGQRDRRRKIYVQRADQMFAVNVEIGDGDGGVAGDFALDSQAGLLHARGYEIGGEGGDVVGYALSESGGQIARCGEVSGQIDQRVGIGGKDLVIVIVGVVQKDLSVGDAVFGGDGGVVDLRNANVEKSVSGADYERVGLADGIRESGARAEIVGLERDFAGGRE